MKKSKIVEEAIVIFWLFIIGSFLGHLFEIIVVFFQKGHFEKRQGLFYGPLIPVYGIGIIVYYIILNNINTKNKWKIFLITMILGGLTEYVCSFVQGKVFGTISWDYSYLTFNFNGRTSLLHSTYWGIAGVLYVSLIDSYIQKLKTKINKKELQIITLLFAIFIIFDIIISCIATYRQTERKNNIAPKNQIDILLDTYYTDEFIDGIFTNKKDRR